MIEPRPKATLGRSSFSRFVGLHHVQVGSPHDNPAHAPIGNLMVWNDDEIAQGMGVPFHRHADAEIITYLREGDVSHEDDLGNRGRLSADDVQVMSAGSGISHSEFSEETTRIFQIWIMPRERGGEPRWEMKSFPRADRAGRLVVLASGFDEDVGALRIRADARLLGATLLAGQTIAYDIDLSRQLYLVPARGRVSINGVVLEACDGAAIRDEVRIHVRALDDAELVIADLTRA